jgi:polysaccharide export outer membrane protein
MRNLKWLFIAVLVVCARPVQAEEYKVSVGDRLNIQVINQDKLNGLYTISPDGSFTFPMIGMVPAAGQSLSEIKKSLTQKLREGYFKSPVVNVSLDAHVPPKFFIYGEVKSPGEYELKVSSLTVLHALTMAGGLTKAGSESKVKLMRPKSDGLSYEVFKVDLNEIFTQGTGDQVLKQGDIILVQGGFF